MKRNLKIFFSLILLLSINAKTAYATVYQPNTDIPVEEITTQSSPSITTRAANPEGSWQQNSTGWWWEYPDGSYAKNTWLQIDNYWYYFNNDGYMLSGWQYINNEWYYLNPGSINDIPFGAMATGWQSIYSDNYQKDFDYYFGPDGDMKDSPSEQFVSYGHLFSDINTIGRAQEEVQILKDHGFEGTVRINRKASEVLDGYDIFPDYKAFLNTGLFICNGHGGPGTAIFSESTALSGTLSGKDPNGYECTSISGNDMNNCKIALFFGCETALIGDSGVNVNKGDLLEEAQAEGALGAFGFNKTVNHSSDNKFAPALVEELAIGKTLKDAAKSAKSTVPLWDNCRDYRIVGEDTKFTIVAETYSREPLYDIPEEEIYVLFETDDDGYETYVQLINGIMTSDYYIMSPDGDVTAIRNEISENDLYNLATDSNAIRNGISENDLDNLATNSNAAKTNSLADFDSEQFYVYEKINEEIKLLEITQEEINCDGYKTLEITVRDVKTGNKIPYESILANY